MSAITVNAFPPLHTFNSSRSWFLAIIVLVHLGFFWALMQGRAIIVEIAPPVIVDFLPDAPKPPPQRRELEQLRPDFNRPFVPVPEHMPDPTFDDPRAPIDVTSNPQSLPTPTTIEGPGSGPLIVEPATDPRFPLSEPEYPVAEIRLQHQGTVWLALQILPSGRVGAVRIDQSSGYARLDDSAVREARRWRMKPGTQDGVAAAMWKRVPITFRLKD